MRSEPAPLLTSLGAYVSLVVNTGDDKALFVMARFFLGRGRGDLVLRKKRLLGDVIFGFFGDLLRDVMIDEDFADVADAIFLVFFFLRIFLGVGWYVCVMYV